METVPTIATNAAFVSMFANQAVLDIVKVLTGAIFYGLYIILLPSAISILCRREGKRTAKMVLLGALLVMFVMSSFEFWGIALLCFRGIQDVLGKGTETTYDENLMAFLDGHSQLASVIQVMLPLETVLGDTIVLWRVWQLFPENRKLIYVPISLLLGTTVTTLGFFGCYAKNDWPVITPDTCNKLQISAFSLSMATNLSGTLVIGYKVWIYRQAVGSYLYQCRRRTRAEKSLVLLLESGFAYSILWIIQLVVILMPPAETFPGQVVQQIFTAASIQLVGIYPTLLVVLIYLQWSMWDPTGTLSAQPISGITSNSMTVYDVSHESKSTLTSKIV